MSWIQQSITTALGVKLDCCPPDVRKHFRCTVAEVAQSDLLIPFDSLVEYFPQMQQMFGADDEATTGSATAASWTPAAKQARVDGDGAASARTGSPKRVTEIVLD